MALDNSNPLVWIDCEMTGLNPDEEEIIEIFCIVTNGNLEILDEKGWGAVIHQSKQRMDEMDEWCTNQHGKTGLTAAVIESKVTAEEASTNLLEYIMRFMPDPQRGLLAGNTVHADKAFLRKEPYAKVMEHLSYRILDVSTLKEAARRWSPNVYNGAPPKQSRHRAKEDILDSIAEAKHYKEALFDRPRQGTSSLK